MYKMWGKIAQRRPRRFRLLGSGHGDDGVSPGLVLPKHGRAVGVPSSVSSAAPVLSLAGSTKYSSSRALSPRTASRSATRRAHQDMDSSSSIEPMTSSPSILEHFSNVRPGLVLALQQYLRVRFDGCGCRQLDEPGQSKQGALMPFNREGWRRRWRGVIAT